MAIKKIKLPNNTEQDINDARVVSDAITYIGSAAGTATYVDGGQIIDVTTKADKVVGATNGNFASLDSTGNLADSGHKHSDYQEKLVSGTNIKTINNTSLLGSGNIDISGGGSDLPSVTASDYGKFLAVEYNSTEGYFWNKSAALVIESMLVSTMFNYDFLVPGSFGNTRISTNGITKYSFSDWSWLKINYAAGGTTVTKTLEDALGAKYELPSGGIPKTSLASAVQTSLGKADTALQSYTETDPVFAASAAHGISSTDISNWNAKQKAITVSTSEPTSSQGSDGDIWIVI